VPTVLIEKVPKVEQKKQPSNTKLRQKQTVTVNQTNQDVKAAQNFDPNLKLITLVTRLKTSQSYNRANNYGVVLISVRG